MKADPSRLVRAHYATFVDLRDGRTRKRDYLLFLGVPVAVGVYCRVQGTQLPAGASAGLLTVAGLLSAFLFGVLLQISQRAMAWVDSEPTPSAAVSEQADFLRELAANSGYAALVSVLAAGIFVVTAVTSGGVLTWFSAVGIAVIVHLGAVLLMVMQSVFALTENRLKVARTGAEVRRLPERRQAS